ncbi:MAG: helix-turn-helix transcriptional regulator, partial [Chloroflexota bacterium]
MGCKLTLISASAGFGKTTLVSEWLAGCSRPAAWLSLDEGDNDPPRFLAYLIAALQTIAPEAGAGALAALKSPQLPAAEAILTALLNDLHAVSEHFILVLDDYHVIDSKPVDQALSFIVEHLPPQMHLVVATREDPPLLLARLRARAQLTELRGADLRFTPAEAADFLNRTMGLKAAGLNLSPQDIAALEQRTEGWIAGLQLAAIALRTPLSAPGHPEPVDFIQSFTGSHRFVLDYLVGEVLQRQPERVRSFLLQTSILERLNGALCNAVTDQDDGKAMLEALERGNLFVVPLDDRRTWYRYHHLFAEVLQTYLRDEQPDQAPVLHRRASLWYEQNDQPAEAIRHALAAQDFDRAAAMIERVWLAMDISYQSAAWLGWVKALPEELVRLRPVVSFGYAWALLNGGELEASEARLREAERWLEAGRPQAGPGSAGMVVVDEEQFRSLPAAIAAARAYRALAMGDIPGTKAYARQALALVREEDLLHRTQATALLGLAEYASGDLPAAEQELLKFRALMWQANDAASAIGITFVLADIKLAQGRLQEAAGDYRQSLQLANRRGVPAFLGASDLYRGLSELLCEQGDLAGAAQHLSTARQLGEQGALTGWPQRVCLAEARIREAQGDQAGALALYEEAERQYVRNPLPDRSIGALKARTWARQGCLDEALAWAHRQGLSPGDELSYLSEFGHLTLARVLIAQFTTNRADGSMQAALGLLERLWHAAEAGGRNGSLIEILILQALAYQAQGDQAGAPAALERALALAEPEGYVRTFVDEGEAIRRLLETCSHRSGHPQRAYAEKLLAAFRSQDAAPKTGLIEPLSERELEVLRLLRSDLSGPEIAQQLIV